MVLRSSIITDKKPTWYAVCRKDNGLPILIYWERKRAEWAAIPNGCKVVAVQPVVR